VAAVDKKYLLSENPFEDYVENKKIV